MKPLIPLISLLIVLDFIQANTNELCRALSEQCHLNINQASSIILNFRAFTLKLKVNFLNSHYESPANAELLRELCAADIWLFLTRTHPSLLQQLQVVRNVISGLRIKMRLSETCLNWFDTLLGDTKESFNGSYVELLIKSLSATRNTQLVDLSTRQLLFVLTQLRRMKMEREYLFLSTNQEMREFYVHYMLNYHSLITLPPGTITTDSVNFNVFSFIPSALIDPILTVNHTRDSAFICKYVDHQKDFIHFNDRMHLKKTTHFTQVYESWLRMMLLIPDESLRRSFFNEQKDLTFNLKMTERLIEILHSQEMTFSIEMGKKVLINLAITFDLIESLVSYEGRAISMIEQKQKLIDVLTGYLRRWGCIQ